MNVVDLIKQIIDNVSKPDIITCKVTSCEPLILADIDDINFTISEDLLILPEHLTEHKVDAIIGEKTYKIIVNGNLKQGDIVYIISFNKGESYFVLGRKGG